jgi:hypothetical protein
VRGGEPKPASALECTLGDLLKWADVATTGELAAVRAARSGDRAILLIPQRVSIPSATRYWGEDVLVPVGFRPEPDLPPATLRAAVEAEPDELVFLKAEGTEIVPRGAFEPLTRAGVRLAFAARK